MGFLSFMSYKLWR